MKNLAINILTLIILRPERKLPNQTPVPKPPPQPTPIPVAVPVPSAHPHPATPLSLFQTECTPDENAILESVKPDAFVSQILSLTLDEQFQFEAYRRGKLVGQLRVTVKMAADASFYLDSGKAKLYFDRDENAIAFHHLDGEDPWLSLLWVAMPKIPSLGVMGNY